MTKIALQLWSVQEACQQDFVGTLRKVAAMGYDGVEFAGYAGMSALELKNILNEVGLEVAGSHISFEYLTTHFEEVVAFEKEIGNTRIVIPWLQAKTPIQWQDIFKTLHNLQAKLAKEGLQLIYHNHAHELLDFPDFNVLVEMSQAVPDIWFEVDTYWIAYAGIDVISWLERFEDQLALVHLKEMTGEQDTRESTEIGSGYLPLKDYVSFVKRQNLPWIIIEQEAFQSLLPMESAAINVKKVKELI